MSATMMAAVMRTTMMRAGMGMTCAAMDLLVANDSAIARMPVRMIVPAAVPGMPGIVPGAVPRIVPGIMIVPGPCAAANDDTRTPAGIPAGAMPADVSPATAISVLHGFVDVDGHGGRTKRSGFGAISRGKAERNHGSGCDRENELTHFSVISSFFPDRSRTGL